MIQTEEGQMVAHLHAVQMAEAGVTAELLQTEEEGIARQEVLQDLQDHHHVAQEIMDAEAALHQVLVVHPAMQEEAVKKAVLLQDR